ncbi:Uncharacterized protein BP5553_07055 [Venustampulla echinocandica]|uniref:Mitochondrial import inner membrane translocase subunit TIM50 n=1 Tax=Venustampulla echinocandica TaxID=2656787 RepID=A0A370TIE0_9HELO|nr:Uncharacterized protein BP5553_07055 [Venustampulla echinocandica]RDL35124.1 Uncharacterized protein BP5553_07055 [Venustampulla echinocandica]
MSTAATAPAQDKAQPQPQPQPLPRSRPQPQPLKSVSDTYSNPQPQSRRKESKPIPEDLDSLTESLKKVSISNERRRPTRKSAGQHTPAQPWERKQKKMSSGSRQQKVDPSKESGGIPDPTPAYLQRAHTGIEALQVPKHLLVVIDLNGTILYRPNKSQPTRFVARPHAVRFLEYCIETFHVVIWSSARPENVQCLVDAIIPPQLKQKVLAVWARDKFDLTHKDYNLRVQCYKRLSKIWADPHISSTHPDFAMGARWDQTNTVLVDDSLEKGRSEPFNLIEIPEFFGDLNERGNILPQVHDYLNYLSMHSNVSACLQAAGCGFHGAPEREKSGFGHDGRR